jgi:hypothetical protein
MRCEACDEDSFLIPLHGGKGGPLRCPLCVGKWNAEHGRRRKAGRVVIRALRAFLDAGGKPDDIDKLKNSAWLDGVCGLGVDELGYMDGIARLDGGDIDLTSELLSDLLRLTHPDCHPPERQDLARRVTQQLLALQPFAFPTPKPEPEPGPKPSKTKTDVEPTKLDNPPKYPCADCADTVPANYCDVCQAEYERRQQEEFERRTAKQRAQYGRRRQRRLAVRAQAVCAGCGKKFKPKRDDARHCSGRCRQRAHRKAVTDKRNSRARMMINRDKIGRDILAMLDRHRAVYLNDLLPETRTRAQYQAVALIAAKLEAEEKIDTYSFLVCWNRPGYKVLAKRGYEVEDREKIALLKDSERLRLDA